MRLTNTESHRLATIVGTQAKLGKPLSETEQRLRTIVGKAPVVLFALDPDGIFTLSEGSALNKLGLQPAEVVGQSVFEVYREHPRILMNVRRALRGEEFSSVEDVVEQQMTFETHWAPLRDAEGNLAGTIAVAVDVSERNRNAREREQAQVLYRSLVEQLAAVTYIAELGLEGQWLFVSPQIESLLGYKSHDWLNRSANWIEHVHPEDREIVAEAENATLLGNPFRAEYRMLRRDGNIVWINDSGTLVRGDDGRSLIHGVLVDVTEQKQLQGRLAQSARMEAVGQLASGVAHDFNNLLTIIKGYSSLLLEKGSASRNTHAAHEILEAADRAAALTRQLLAFGRKQTLQPRILDLNTIVRGLEKMLRRVVAENVELVINTNPAVGCVNADPVQMEQVLLNLVVNARDAMPNGGKLTISTAYRSFSADIGADENILRAGSYVALSVHDTGIGMDAATRARVFEPFFTTKELGKGTGLGLSTVYGIVKQSNGQITVDSQLGKGSTFTIFLPQVHAEAIPAPKTTPSEAPTPATGTILLAEDEPLLRELGETILQRAGYSVVTAPNTATLATLIRTYPDRIDLLLTDVIMPNMSGPELAKLAQTRWPELRVLYMSGYADDDLQELKGDFAFLQKPFTPAELTAKIAEVLRGK